MSIARGIAAAVLLSVISSGAARAQGAADDFAAGVKAYDDLQFADAAARLQRAVIAGGDSGLLGAARSQAYAYLGAARWFNGERERAAAAFTALLVRDPGFHLDTLRFPPVVTGLFDAIRRSTYAVRATPQTSVELRGGRPGMIAQLLAVAPHHLLASLVRPDGRVVKELFNGWVADTLTLNWDGTVAGTAPDSGSYQLLLVSFNPTERPARMQRFPIEVATLRRDTLPQPPPPDEPPPRPGSLGPATIGWGLASAGAAIALPRVVSGSTPSPGGVVIAGSIGIATVIGVLRAAARSTPATVDVAAQRRWRDSVTVIRRENERRRADTRVLLRIGDPLPGSDQL